jgi:hypothetical protein
MDFGALLIFILFWIGGVICLINTLAYQDWFLRLQFSSFALALFTGASFYAYLSYTSYTGAELNIEASRVWARIVFVAIGTLLCLNATAWLVLARSKKSVWCDDR